LNNDEKPAPIPDVVEEKPTSIPQQPINGQPSGLRIPKKRRLNKAQWRYIIISAVVVSILFGASIWYNIQLSPLSKDQGSLKVIDIKPGTNLTTIGKLLQDEGVIRDAFVFDLYMRLSSNRSNLQAGKYRLSPGESVQSIVGHLTKGNVDQFNITFYPGATLVDNSDTPISKKYDVTTVLEKAGFTEAQISEGLSAKYDDASYNMLFDGRPASSGLEGYIYGETYSFNSGATVRDIFEYTFRQFYKEIKENNLIDGFKKQGLNLYQAITLASIVQREVSNSDDAAKVAQVFLSRYRQGIKLGSDVTYQYIADRMGVPRDIDLPSPYNTRKYTGLPPGPIAVPGLVALEAVARPASTNYLFFLSGDNDITYFSYTDAEHQANIVNYCQVKCSSL